MERLSAAAARRIALAAQGFADPRPTGRIDRRHARRVFARIGLVQIDSVNVFVRSQELPLFARLGPHRRDLVPAMAADGELFEYWGHEASLLPVEREPLLRFRMAEARRGEGIWGGLARFGRERSDYVAAVLEIVKERGPVRAADLRDSSGSRRPESWWSWDDAKRALELLFWSGQVSARRLPNFERSYDLTERLLPAWVLAQPTPTPQESRRELLAAAAASLGVATVADLCDYYRLNVPAARPAIAELVEDGRVVRVGVDGWKAPAYLHPSARQPRRVDGRALLSPFDSLVWERARTERVFGFRYRIELYTPASRRQYGYYVLPFLLGSDLVARVDLKSDRKASGLLVQAAWAEPGASVGRVAEALAVELRSMADWLRLDRVVVGERGDLAGAVRACVAQLASDSASDTS